MNTRYILHCATKNLTPQFGRFTSGQAILAPPSADRMGKAMVHE